MNKFTKKDLLFSVVTGLYAGFIAWRISIFLKVPPGFDYGDSRVICGIVSCFKQYSHHIYFISWSWLVIIVPVVWILGVGLGYFLGRWLPFFNQFGRFAAIGFTNFIVYSGILNLLIAFTRINSGIWYSVFVGVSFIVGMVHSFGWNKYWVFSAEGGSASGGESKVSASSGGGVEFGKFISVSVVAGLVNVAVASFVVDFIHPLFGISANGWANVGGIAGSAVALIFSFIGFKMVVFKSNRQLTTNN